MKDNVIFDTYLFLSPQKIIISVYEKHKLENIFFKEIVNVNNKEEISLDQIDSFLEKNIFDIEKSLKSFVKNIYLIVQSNDSLNIQISIKKNNYGDIFTKNKLMHLLNEAKDECKKTIGDRKIIHMLIENYLIDKKDYSLFTQDLKCDFFSVDIRFVCLSKAYIKDIEKILKKYQVSTSRILQSEYIKSFLCDAQEDLFQMAIKIIDGYNQNEVLIVPKLTKNEGFFERFFNFFN